MDSIDLIKINKKEFTSSSYNKSGILYKVFLNIVIVFLFIISFIFIFKVYICLDKISGKISNIFSEKSNQQAFKKIIMNVIENKNHFSNN